ncbi:hypothetical protein B296_00012118 [Ensete ventricosum]|uniref:Uncharacterized protein n=1 Tax=Ensete ventricosum TaxID=4639 RepID=A0A427B822_ENSVE|nr:hypothetical protein B296_00012118 [Ensete ventricosum]
MGYHVQRGSHVSQAKLLRCLGESKRPLSKRCLSLISFVATLVRGHSYSPSLRWDDLFTLFHRFWVYLSFLFDSSTLGGGMSL